MSGLLQAATSYWEGQAIMAEMYGFLVVCRDTAVVVLENGASNDEFKVISGWESYDGNLMMETPDGKGYLFAVDSEERNEAPWFVASGFLHFPDLADDEAVSQAKAFASHIPYQKQPYGEFGKI